MIDCLKCYYLCKRIPGSGYKEPLESCAYYWPEEEVSVKMTIDRIQGIDHDRWYYLSMHNREVERNMDKIDLTKGVIYP